MGEHKEELTRVMDTALLLASMRSLADEIREASEADEPPSEDRVRSWAEALERIAPR